MVEDTKQLETLSYRPDFTPKNNSPNQNLMIIEQAEGASKVVLTLLESIEPKTTQQKDDKEGCIWTLKGWVDNNLKHLRGTFE